MTYCASRQNGYLPARVAAEVLSKGGLPAYVLKGVWAAAKSRDPPHDRMNVKEFMMACKLVANFKKNPKETTAGEKAEKLRQAAAEVAKSKHARLERSKEQDAASHAAALKAAADRADAEKAAAARVEAGRVNADKAAVEKVARERAAAEMEAALQKAREEATEAAAELDAAQELGKQLEAAEAAAAARGDHDHDHELYSAAGANDDADEAGEDEYVDVSTIHHAGFEDVDGEEGAEAKKVKKVQKKKEAEYGEGMAEVWSKPPVVNGRCTECHSKEAWCMCTKKRGFQADIQGVVALNGLEGLIGAAERSEGEDSDDLDSDEDPVSPDWQLQQRLGIGTEDGSNSGSEQHDSSADSDGGGDVAAPSFVTPEASPAAIAIAYGNAVVDDDGASSDDPDDSDDEGDAVDGAGSGQSTKRVLVLDGGGAMADVSSTDATHAAANIDESAVAILGVLQGIAGVTDEESSSDDATGAVAAAVAAAFKAPLSVRDAEINAAAAANAAGTPLWVRSQSESSTALFGQYADRFFNAAYCCDPDLPQTAPKVDLLHYTRGQTISLSLKRLDGGGKKVSKLAVQIYMDLARHVRGEMLPAESLPFIRTTIAHCLNSKDLRGEIVCQLVRQSNGNPSIEQQLRCWHLVCVFCSSFPAGEGLAEAFEAYATDRRRNAAACARAAAREATDPKPLLKAGASSLTDPAVVVQQQLELSAKLCELEQYAACAVQAIQKVAKWGPRRNAPGVCVIEALRTQTPILRRFYFITGDSAAVSFDPFSTTNEVAEAVARTVGLESAIGWALFETTPQAEHWICDTEYIADVLTEWEDAVMVWAPDQGAKHGKPKRENKKSQKKSKIGAKFVFRKRLFFAGEQLSVDDESTARLLYAQAVHSVTRADEYGVSKETALQLAGLQAQVKYGNPDHQDPNPEWYGDVLNFIPWRITADNRVQASRDQWSTWIFQAHVQHGSGKSKEEARMLFLNAVLLFPLYGAAQFEVSSNGGTSLPDRMFLAVSAKGIRFVDYHSRAILPARTYLYAQLATVEVSPDKEVIALTLVDDVDDEIADKHRYLFRCSVDAENIANLIVSYSPTHQEWVHAKESPNATARLQRQEDAAAVRGLQQCNAEIATARSDMARDGYMLPPPQPKSMMTKLQKRLSRRSTRAKSFAGNFEDDTQYPDTFWAFQKVPIAQPLLFVVSLESVDVAINMFNTLLVYAGIMEQAVPKPDIAVTAGLAGGGVVVQDPIAAAAAAAAAAAVNDPNHVLLIQNLISATLEKEECCNEFYMQIIKQTTRCPPPTATVTVGSGMGSKSNSGSEMAEASNRLQPSITASGADVGKQIWSMFAIAVGIVIPRHAGIVRMIEVHIARHVIDPNPEVAAAALLVGQAYARTQKNKNRKHPPSQVEVLCRMKQLPIYSDVHFAGGKRRAVAFDPATNTAELVDILKEQLGLPDQTVGFSVFEVFGELERNMLPWEKLADAMFKWDRYSEHVDHSRKAAALASGQAAPKTGKQKLQLTFKRRLFLGPFTVPRNPMEFLMTVDQAVDDVRHDRFPVTFDEATVLVAIRAQALLGDCDCDCDSDGAAGSGVGSGMYASILKTTLPVDISKSLNRAEIVREHQKLSGKGAGECNTEFLSRVMTWPLYGSTIFEVQQSFTAELPGILWLAINEDGIQALEKRSTTAIRFDGYRSIVNYSPSMKELKIVVAPSTPGSQAEKLVFGTRQASQIAHLIKDYTHIIIQQVQSGASPKAAKSRTPISKYKEGGKISPSRTPNASPFRKKDMAKVPAKLMLEPFVEPDVLETAGKNASDDAVSAAISASILGGSKKSKPADETFFGTAGAKELVTAAAASPTIVGSSKMSAASEDTFFGPSDASKSSKSATDIGRATITVLPSPKAGAVEMARKDAGDIGPLSATSTACAEALAAVVLQTERTTEETFFGEAHPNTNDGADPGAGGDNSNSTARGESNSDVQGCFTKLFSCFGSSEEEETRV